MAEPSGPHGRATSHGRIEMDLDADARSDGDRTRAVRDRAGDGLEQAGDALHRAARKAETQGGTVRRVAPAADRLGDGLEDAAEYVRATELTRMRDDLEDTVRSKPIRSLAIAAVTGYLVGRILR